ncbi:MAG: glycosyltransferase family 39 protein, partial [Chloroflexi bacterium]|nr:glycosyltransferase family 39 protein [Chloroflexota bacterium]
MSRIKGVSKGDWAFAGLVAAVVGLGAYLRLSHLDIIPFHEDSARSLLLARWYMENHAMPWVSTMASVGILNAPIDMYLNMAALLISSDPAVITSLYALANVLALALSFLLVARTFGKPAALIVTALYATSFWAIWWSRGVWNVTLAPLLAVLFMSSLYSFVAKRNERALVWAFLWLAFLVQTSFATLPYIPLFIIALLIFRARIRARYLAVGCVLFILPLVPYLYWEISHNFYNLRALVHMRSGGTEGGSFDLNAWRYAIFVMGSAGYNKFFGPPMPQLLSEPAIMVALRRIYEYVFYVSFAYLIARLILDRRSLRSGKLNGHLLLALWFALPVAIFLPHRWPLYIHYLIPLFPAQFTIVAVASVEIGRHSTRLIGQGLSVITSRWTPRLAYLPALLLLLFFGAITTGQTYVYLRFDHWIGEETVTPNYGVPLKYIQRAVDEARRYSIANGGAPIYVGISDKTVIGDNLSRALPYYSTKANPLLFFDEGRALVLSPSSHPTVYLLTSTDSEAANLLEHLSPDSQVERIAYPGDADAFSIYLVPPDAGRIFQQAQEKALPLPLRWPNGVELLAYTMDEHPEAGGDLALTLYWKISDSTPPPSTK